MGNGTIIFHASWACQPVHSLWTAASEKLPTIWSCRIPLSSSLCLLGNIILKPITHLCNYRSENKLSKCKMILLYDSPRIKTWNKFSIPNPKQKSHKNQSHVRYNLGFKQREPPPKYHNSPDQERGHIPTHCSRIGLIMYYKSNYNRLYYFITI